MFSRRRGTSKSRSFQTPCQRSSHGLRRLDLQPRRLEILESVPVVLPSVPVTGIRQPHELIQPVIAPTSPSAATIQRRLLQKSRPFWEIQADAKRKAEEQERTRTPSPTSSENDELDAVIINEVRSMVAACSVSCDLTA